MTGYRGNRGAAVRAEPVILGNGMAAFHTNHSLYRFLSNVSGKGFLLRTPLYFFAMALCRGDENKITMCERSISQNPKEKEKLISTSVMP